MLMFDRIDEWTPVSPTQYGGKPMKNLAKGELPLDETEKAKQDNASKAAEPLPSKITQLPGDRVGEVKALRLSNGGPGAALRERAARFRSRT